jgi:hypothetical protein
LLTLTSALDLTTKIIGALKEAGGASAEYQHAFIEIEGLQRTLQNVAKLVPTENNLEHVNAIRGLALSCERPLTEFLRTLKRYEPSIGSYAPKGAFQGSIRKMRWAFHGSDEFKEFRRFIGMKVLCINLLLSMQLQYVFKAR